MQTVVKIHGAAPVSQTAGCVGVPGRGGRTRDGWAQGPGLLVGAGVSQPWRKLQHEVGWARWLAKAPPFAPLAVSQAAISAADSSEKRG